MTEELKKWYPLTLEDLPGEKWVEIRGYEGLYQVSNYGRVKAFKKFGKDNIYIKSVYLDEWNRIRVELYNNNDKKRGFTIGMLVARHFLDCPGNILIQYKDENTYNNNVNNIYWSDWQENERVEKENIKKKFAATITEIDGEIWKNIKGYKNQYQISSMGRVKSLDRIDSLGKTRYAKIFKNGKDSYGYLQVSLTKLGKAKTFKIHRLVAVAFIGDYDTSILQINHKDGNKENNNVNNLEIVTCKTNMQHAFATGLCSIGEDHANAKLTEKQVLEIRSLFEAGKYNMTDLARMFNMGRTTIGHIISRDNWKHI